VILAVIFVLWLFSLFKNPISDFVKRQFDKVSIRFDIWLHFLDDRYDKGWQLYQGVRAMQGGGTWGADQLSIGRIPVSNSDMIFPMIVQVTGKVFGVFIILIFLIYTLINLHVAIETKDHLNRAVAFGITVTLFMQFCFQVAGSTTVFVLSGNTVPFLSRGNTSLMVCALMSMIIYRIHVKNIEDAKKRIIETKPQDNKGQV
jgi:cell division protein FtsW (lipid II flippase)